MVAGEAFGLGAERASRLAQSKVLIDQILNGTADGTVDPALGEDLRQKLVDYPSEPDRALLEHLRGQFAKAGMEFDGVFPEDLI